MVTTLFHKALKMRSQIIFLCEWAGDADCTVIAYASVLPKLRDRQQLTALIRSEAKDVFLPDDYLIKQRFPGMTPAQIRRYAERWKPWRSYALLSFAI